MIKDSLSVEEKKGAVAWMAGHSVAANLMMLLCIVGGIMALWRVKQEVFPDLALDIVTISVSYPGASPEEVESGIVTAIEESVRGLDNVKTVSSRSSEGVGVITVEMLLGGDLQRLSQDVQSEVDRIRGLPQDSEDPVVSIAARSREVLELVLYGDAPATSMLHYAETIQDILLQNEKITKIEIEGLPELEISVEVPQENLRRYGLTLADIATKINQSAIDIPGGGIKADSGEILIRMKERRDYGRQFKEIPIIAGPDGAVVTLGQIATITDGFEETDRYALYNGKPTVTLEVYRIGDQTPVQVADAVRAALPDIEAILPAGLNVVIMNDGSKNYKDRVELLVKNAMFGLVLVFITLGLFLDVRLAFWVMLGIPVSFLGTLLLMPSMDVSINMMTLFAFIIALGIVVDDAIVVGENVYHYRQDGYSFLAAAVKGVREVSTPVTFSILTNIATFVPIALIPGVMGKIFRMVPIVVCTIFIISLLESVFILPAHLGHQRKRKPWGPFILIQDGQQAFSHWFTRWVRRRYAPFLEFTLAHRYLSIAAAIAMLVIASGYALSGRMGMSVFPTIESDYSQATVTLPYGASINDTGAIAKRMVAEAQKIIDGLGHPEYCEGIVADVGRGGSHAARVRVYLAPSEIRDKIMLNEEFTKRWREAVGEMPGAKNLRFEADAGGPGSFGRAIAIELSHRDRNQLTAASIELAERIETYAGVRDVDDGFQLGKEQLDLTITDAARSLGLTATTIARQVRAALQGVDAISQQRGRNEILMRVRSPQSERASEQFVNDLMIRTPSGAFVPFGQVAHISRGRAYMSIDRRQGRRINTVTADMVPRSKAGEVLALVQSDDIPALQKKYPGLVYSLEGHQADMRESMNSLKLSFPLALMAIYVLLAIPFRSYSQPLIVMLSIPFGIIGAILGHLIMGYTLSLPSMFGIVALAGVVVNDALVMVDFANRRRNEDKLNPHDAIVSAATQRFRPIILTTLTTFGGLAPMIFESSRQARFLIPMALSLGYGIVFGTLITLVIVPAFYLFVEDAEGLVRRLKRAKK
ncbi:MAG: efflux RND transporter permease subunit [Planctomycetota bacterium]